MLGGMAPACPLAPPVDASDARLMDGGGAGRRGWDNFQEMRVMPVCLLPQLIGEAKVLSFREAAVVEACFGAWVASSIV
jgi:hypothetical protein